MAPIQNNFKEIVFQNCANGYDPLKKMAARAKIEIFWNTIFSWITGQILG